MAASVESRMTDCSICMDELNNPRCLPCSHTFCCQCLENWCAEKRYYGRPSCPLCNSVIDVPAGGRCSKFPRNVYAEELVRVSREVEDNNRSWLQALQVQQVQQDELADQQNKLADMRAQLKRKDDKRQKVVKALVEANTRLVDAESRCKDAEVEAISCKQAKADTEVSLADQQNKLADMRAQLKRKEDERQKVVNEKTRLDKALAETTTRLVDAESRCKDAEVEAISCKQAMTDTEVSLANEKRLCQNLQQQLQRKQHEFSKQLQDAKDRHNTEASSLKKSKQLCEALQREISNLKADLKSTGGIFISCFR